MGASIRTFFCGLLAPGLGYWLVDKRRYGLATGALTIAVVLLVSWTRLVLEPLGIRAAIVCLLALLSGSALHAAFLDSRGIEFDRRWRSAVLYAIGVGIVFSFLFAFRGDLLGYEAYRLPGQSMAPTLTRGDRIIVDTWRYRDAEPQIDDIVVFLAPDTGITYVKRIVGIPGDLVSLEGSQVTRNGDAVDEPFAVYRGSGPGIGSFSGLSVPPGQYLVLGDNRNDSRDSRHFGLVPRENVVGVVALTL